MNHQSVGDQLDKEMILDLLLEGPVALDNQTNTNAHCFLTDFKQIYAVIYFDQKGWCLLNSIFNFASKSRNVYD